jgi:hypothetical protein
VKPLLDILEQVGDGTMEHDAGVESLVALYGIPRATAEKMVPEGPPPARRYGQVPPKVGPGLTTPASTRQERPALTRASPSPVFSSSRSEDAGGDNDCKDIH